jgi:hypothetical protein
MPEKPIVTVDNIRTFEVVNNPSVTQGRMEILYDV